MKKFYILCLWICIICCVNRNNCIYAENVNYKLECTDGTIIDSTPNGVVKLNVIIFGRIGCYNTKTVLENLKYTKYINDERVNFIYVDSDQANIEDISMFEKQINNSNVKFCRCDNSMIMWRMMGISSVTFPAIAYVDTTGSVRDKSTYIVSKSTMDRAISNILGEEMYDTNFEVWTYGALLQNDARNMLNLINDFRHSEDAWYWDEDDSRKIKCDNLNSLTYDYELEKVAVTRVIEITAYFEHERPNGEMFDSAYPSDITYMCKGENIASGYEDEKAVFEAWKEENEKYDGQGHRRNMLEKDYNAIGIACFVVNGRYFWVQEFGYVDKFTSDQKQKKNYDETYKKYSLKISDEIMKLDEAYCVGDCVNVPFQDKYVDNLRLYCYGKYSYIQLYFPTIYYVENSNIVKCNEEGELFGLKEGITTITLKAKISGNFVYEKKVKVIVNKKDIAEAYLDIDDDEDDYEYTGKPIRPDFFVSYDYIELKEGIDYEVEYKNNVGPGKCEFIIRGIGRFKGVLYGSFYIKKSELWYEKENRVDISEVINALNKEKLLKQIEFGKLKFNTNGIKENSVGLKWKKVASAKKYVIYGNVCGKGKKYIKIATVNKLKYVIKKISGKKLKKGTNYKFTCLALDKDGKVITAAKAVHVVTAGGKFGNVKELNLTNVVNKKLTLKKGKTFIVKFKINIPKGKSIANHRGVRFESSDMDIAKVDVKNGKIIAKKKGKCKIFVYTQNGCYRVVSLKVN